MIKIVKNIGQCKELKGKTKWLLKTTFDDVGEAYAKVSLDPILYRIWYKIKYHK